MPLILVRNAICVLAAVLASGVPAHAEVPEEAISRCARIATVGDRILCLETALRQYADVDPEIAVDSEPEIATEAQAEAALTARKPTPESTPAVSASPDTPAPTAEPGPTSEPAASTVELGVEQIAGRNSVGTREAERVNASIVDHELVGYGRLRLTLNNGQVWQQTTDDDRNTARFLTGEDAVPVEMWQSRSGGYRMHLIPFNRTLRVRRLK